MGTSWSGALTLDEGQHRYEGTTLMKRVIQGNNLGKVGRDFL
jgi:hypothetical protein